MVFSAETSLNNCTTGIDARRSERLLTTDKVACIVDVCALDLEFVNLNGILLKA